MRVAFINTTAHPGHGPARLMLATASAVVASGGEALVAYGRGEAPTVDFDATFMKIGSTTSVGAHYLRSLLADGEGQGSSGATRSFLAELERWSPDVVHLHNLHGHYLHLPLLMEWLASRDIPVVVTMHDCWLMTGHCAFYSTVGCNRWIDGCRRDCPGSRLYPSSFVTKAAENHSLKTRLLHSLRRVALAVPSAWMMQQVRQSSLSDLRIEVVPGCVDSAVFRQCAEREEGLIVAAANIWEPRKGLDLLLRMPLREGERLVIAGGIPQRSRRLPRRVETVGKLSAEELSRLMSRASVFVNPSLAETFSLVTVEAMACGVPVVVNATTALPELLGEEPDRAGIAVDCSNPQELRRAVDLAKVLPRAVGSRRASLYSVPAMTSAYLALFKSLSE